MYFLVSLFAFGLRPKAYGSRHNEEDDNDGSRNVTSTNDANITGATASAPVRSLILHNLTEIFCNYTGYHDALIQVETNLGNLSSMDNSTMPSDDTDEWTSFSECPLLDISSIEIRVNDFHIHEFF